MEKKLEINLKKMSDKDQENSEECDSKSKQYDHFRLIITGV